MWLVVFPLEFNQCEIGEGDCHNEHGMCVDVTGSEDTFICKCKRGFIGDGIRCFAGGMSVIFVQSFTLGYTSNIRKLLIVGRLDFINETVLTLLGELFGECLQ